MSGSKVLGGEWGGEGKERWLRREVSKERRWW